MKERHAEIIRLRREQFLTYRQIAERLGCSYTLPHKVLKKHAPELMEHSATLRSRSKFDEMLKLRRGGFTYPEIASFVGLSPSVVESTLHRYAPELTRHLITGEELARQVEEVAKLQRQGLKNREIAERLGITKGRVDTCLMRARKMGVPLLIKHKSYPKLNPEELKKRDREIIALFQNAVPIPDIAAKFDIINARVYQIISKELPEWKIRKERELTRRNRQILKMADSGTLYKEIAKEFDMKVSAVSSVLYNLRKSAK